MKRLEQSNSQLAVSTEILEVSGPVKQIMEALGSKTIANCLPHEVSNPVKFAIEKCYLDTGYKIDGSPEEAREKATYIIVEVSKYIRKTYPALRVDEISIAFANGIRKKYGDYMGLSVISFCNFIDGHVKDENRRKALAEKNKPVEEKKIPTVREVFDLSKSNALRALSDVKTGRDIYLYGSVVYGFLGALKLICISKEEANDYFEAARVELIAEYKEKSEGEFDRVKRLDLKNLSASLEDIEGITKDLKTKIWVRAECLAVKDFMLSVIMDEIDLSQEIESRFHMVENMSN